MAAAAPRTEVEPRTLPHNYYERVVDEHDRQVLQLSARVLRHPASGTSLTLLSMLHIGLPSYYASLEAELEGADLILAEGFPSDQDLSREDFPEIAWLLHQYGVIARLLGVTTQTEWEAEVEDPRWTILDAPLSIAAKSLERTLPELEDIKKELEARTWADGSPEELDETRAWVLENLFATASGGDSMAELSAVRDRFIFEGLSEVLREGKHRRIVMVYGLYHVKALEPRLRSRLGFRLRTARWYTALERPLPEREAAEPVEQAP